MLLAGAPLAARQAQRNSARTRGPFLTLRRCEGEHAAGDELALCLRNARKKRGVDVRDCAPLARSG
jgi:hypothetical protein